MRSFLMGLGLGLVGGVLFAPKSGAETRDYIGNKTNDSVDYVKRQTQELRDSAKDMVDRGKDMVDRGKNIVNRFSSQARETGQEVYQR
jgi:gas vesicle protein